MRYCLLSLPAIFLALLSCSGPTSSGRGEATALPTPTELAAGFRDPPDEAKPRTWFHAMSANMSKEGLTKDLESLADVGIGGLLLFNVSQGIPVGDVVYNSEEHHEMLAHAAAESERLGLSFGVHNCDGWSSSGGPWVTPEQSMKMLVYSETIVGDNSPATVQLGQPSKREGYYEDIAVVAYPSLYTEVEDRRNRAQVTTSDPDYDAIQLTDGRIDAQSRLGKKNGPAPWVQFAYERPTTIRSVLATFTDRHATAVLQTSSDGKRWDEGRELKKVRTGKGEWALNDHFGPVESKYFRLQFNQTVELREAALYRTYFVENPLGRTAMARTEDDDLGDIGTAPRGMSIDPETVLNLTANLDANGNLTYDFPPGDWTVLRFGQTSTGAFNNPASWEGRGLEVDKMSRPAFKTHYDAFIRKVVDNAGPVAPNALQYVEIDSYEAGGQNWTTGFESLFKERKGYDLIPFLPLMAGRFMGADAGAVVDEQGAEREEKRKKKKEQGRERLPQGPGEAGVPAAVTAATSESSFVSAPSSFISQAVLYDFREVVTDLITENYFAYFTELCHADGLKTYVEPYGFGPLNDLDVGGTCDLPMGEFWMNREMTMVESAVSAAHIYGKPIVSAESFTSRPEINWKGNPAMAKVSGDKAWARGINEFMFHRFAHQANPNVTPGMTMNRWGFHFDRTQTWWENAGKDWFEYIARGSYLLRQGHPVADLMIFVGDGKPNSRFKWDDFDPAIPKWMNYDNVNADVLINRATLKDGAIALPEGGRYPILALKNCDHLSLPSLRRLVEIAESGVTVTGAAPTTLAGYGHSAEDYNTFEQLAQRLADRLVPTTDWNALLTDRGLTPDLQATTNDSLIYEHRRVGDTDIYFFVNESLEPTSLEVTVRINDKRAERWDPLTGEITPLRRYAKTESGTRVALALDAEESCFLIFRDDLEAAPALAVDQWGLPAYSATDSASVPGPWKVTFREENGFAGELTFEKLIDWAAHPDERVNYYSGTATYVTTFDFDPENDLAYQLDLGEVDIIAEVRLNGQGLSVQWMKPFQVDITEALQPGNNELEIEVTNLWSNRLIGDERFPKQDGGYKMASSHPKIKMPEWYRNNEPVPPGPRTTFTTADFYDADDELEPSGLKGPVRIVALQPTTFTESKKK